jgi:hypothetical protein
VHAVDGQQQHVFDRLRGVTSLPTAAATTTTLVTVMGASVPVMAAASVRASATA